jgi:hypothetical protein
MLASHLISSFETTPEGGATLHSLVFLLLFVVVTRSKFIAGGLVGHSCGHRRSNTEEGDNKEEEAAVLRVGGTHAHWLPRPWVGGWAGKQGKKKEGGGDHGKGCACGPLRFHDRATVVRQLLTAARPQLN